MKLDPRQLLSQAAMFAFKMMMRIREAQFRHGTPPRLRRGHDRKEFGPHSRTSIHMLVRAINKGYVYEPQPNELRPHGRRSERGWQCAKRRPSLARRVAISMAPATA